MFLATESPPIKLISSDIERLSSLAETASNANPHVAEFLTGEIKRATLVTAAEAIDAVTMYSWVEFRYDLTGRVKKVQLVVPAEANINQGKISVMTSIGAALVGLSEGQSIAWRTSLGARRGLTVLKVYRPSSSDERMRSDQDADRTMRMKTEITGAQPQETEFTDLFSANQTGMGAGPYSSAVHGWWYPFLWR
ncbi:MAG TPA: nucleoside diphosphate kinase regulator [Pseudolabrys sp.]|nr:nucleoside diphosphate kinase regulator [Pseudolabrys sp.]